MRARQRPSTTLIAALGLARRTTAQVQDLYNRPIAAAPHIEEPETVTLAAA